MTKEILINIAIAVAFVIVVIWLLSYEDCAYAMKQCQKRHSYETCFNLLQK